MANPNVPNTYIQELEGGFTPYLQNLRDQVASKQITEQAAYNQAAKDFNSVVSKDPNNRLNFSLAAQLAAGNVFGSEQGGQNVVNNFNSALQGNPANTLNIPTQQGMLSPPPVPVTTPTPPPAQPVGMLTPTTPDGSFNYVSPATQDLVGMDTARIRAKVQNDVNPQTVTVGGTTNSVTLQPTVGMLGKSTDLTTGLPEFEIYKPNVTPATLTNALEGDLNAFSDILYNAFQTTEDTRTLRNFVENIGTSISQNSNVSDLKDPISAIARATAFGKMKDDYNIAVTNGDKTKTNELNNVINGSTDEMWEYYANNYKEGSAHKLMQTLFNDPFETGDPGKYKSNVFTKVQKLFVNLGDAFGDAMENPYLQMAVAFIPGVGAPLSSAMQLYGTLDSGDNPNPAQWAAGLMGMSELSGLEGGQLLKSLPPEFQKFATATKELFAGGWDEASTAWKNAFPNSTTDQLSAIEDWARENIDFNKVGDAVANVAEPFKDSGESFLNDFQNILDGFELPNFNQGGEVSQQELSGTPFKAQRGYQGALAVDTDFSTEPSSVLQLLQGLPLSTKQIA